ncbi:MAG: hypothetical protein RLZZ612_938 [Pseudomonadota bacterium]|jgi:site-specific recombinase
MTHRLDLAELLSQLDPQAPLAQRHLWLMALLRWLRGDGGADPSVQAWLARVELLLDAAAARPEWVARWHRWWVACRADVDVAPVLADLGFAPRTAFISELGQRLRKKWLPSTPDTTDLAQLFELLFPDTGDAERLRALPPALLLRLEQLLLPHDDSGVAHTSPASATGCAEPNGMSVVWGQTLLDALTFCVAQVNATGFASEIRVRLSPEARHNRTFHALPLVFEGFRVAVSTHGPRSTQALHQADVLRAHLAACQAAAQTVYAHLDAHGISVGIVFRLHQLRLRVARIEALLQALQAPQTMAGAVALWAELIEVSDDSRSVRRLIASSTHLTAAKVAERSAESGEHYITRNRREYRQMLQQAAGGGVVIGFTTWGKFLLYGLALSPFWAGFAAGMNYALSFVLVQLLHFTVATKQPAVTAPAMVAKLRHIRAPGAVRRFVDEVTHLFRSQVAAIVGNLALVIPTVALIALGLQMLTEQSMLTNTQAEHVLHDLNVWGPTALFAAFTGVLLFASSIIAGWFENWFVLHRLDSALALHPRATRWLGADRARRWAAWLRAHVSGFAANISLGLMLGLVPAIASFLGLGLEVRHVTLSAGQLTAAVAALGWSSLLTPEFGLAFIGVMVVGPLNLAVSFYLAFRLALRAQAISDVHRQRIRAAIHRRIRRLPWSFIWPPAASTPSNAHHDASKEKH